MAKESRIQIRHKDYIEYMMMLLAPIVVSWYYYGADALRLIFTGIISAVLFEAIALFFMRRNLLELLDMHAVFTGTAIAMMLPANANIALVIAGTAFAIFAVKVPFGSATKAPFVPAAAAMAFLTVCFPKEVYNFPIGDAAQTAAQSTSSLAAMLNAGGSYHLNALRVTSIISGNIAGPIGTCCAAALVGVCAFFLVFKPQKLANVAGFVLACAFFAILFPRGSFDRWTSLLTELCAGSLLFGAVFFSTDPAVSPEHPSLRFLYGALGGTICMLLRYFGAYEDPTCFAILLSTAFWPIAMSILRKTHALEFYEKHFLNKEKAPKKSLKLKKKDKTAKEGEQ